MPPAPQPPAWVSSRLHAGIVIPAHPLALTRERRLDERRQRALTRYYHAAGAGGIAVGVHTTQFAIRSPQHGMLKPVLQLAAETAAHCDDLTSRQTVLIAGLCGPTTQAVSEAQLARELGYHSGLLSLAAHPNASNDELISHCQTVAAELPVIGFYLQTAAGGRILTYDFWRRFAEIPNVIAIKIAPFNRYQTWDVLRAVAESSRAQEIALYTGNDDHIIVDLVTEHVVPTSSGEVRLRFAGGLLGHWACWTRRAVELLTACQRGRATKSLPAELLIQAAQVTDSNAAFFDPAHGFAGCIPGLHEVLRRQGLLGGIECLDPKETLSPGQSEEIDRVYAAYPHLNDDEFVDQHRDDWLS